MLISKFAKAAGISTDTARFYVRRGLLRPALSSKGGRHPYMVFSVDHIEAVRVIRTAQSLGLSLREIAAINKKYGGDSKAWRDSSADVVEKLLAALHDKATEIEALSNYLKAKLDWLIAKGSSEDEPKFSSFV